MTLEYLDPTDVSECRTDDCRPYGHDQYGYGLKVATPYMVRLCRDKRWRRVYCTIVSNNGTLWVTVGGERHILAFDPRDYV